MKHPTAEELRQLLGSGLQSMGLEIPERAAEQCVDFLLGILDANQSVNLTGISEPKSAVRLHLLDSLAALPEVEQSPEGELLDLGSGGGFPGVPLGLATLRRAVLLDSVRKKAKAVRRVAQECGLSDLDVRDARAEDLARTDGQRFAVVVARAVGRLPSLVELAAPLLRDGGRLVALKGRLTAQELEAGDRVACIVGLSRVSAREFDLPEAGDRRRVIVYEKKAVSEIPLPRRTGLAQSRPLA